MDLTKKGLFNELTWHLTERYFMQRFHQSRNHLFNCDFCLLLILNVCSDLDPETDDIDEDDVGPAEKDIRCIFEKVASYMQIAQDYTVYMVPKAIMHHIIRKVEKFINTDLLVQIVNDTGANEVSFFSGFQNVFCSFIHDQ